MRLTPHEQAVIKAASLAHFDAPVRLFGSRLIDTKRGGDIDLLIMTPLTHADMLDREIAFRNRLETLIGERQVDIVFHQNGQHLSAMADIALTTGIIL